MILYNIIPSPKVLLALVGLFRFIKILVNNETYTTQTTIQMSTVNKTVAKISNQQQQSIY